MAAREFTNRYPGVKCSKCGAEIAIGAPMAWNRRKDQPSQRWHIACTPAETENATDFASTEMRQTVRHQEEEAGAGASWMDGLAGAMAPYLEARIATKLDRDEVEQIVEALLGNAIIPTVTTVRLEDARTGQARDLGMQHRLFPTLLNLCHARMNVWLTGPAGSGKTTAVQKIADALNLKWYHVGAMDNEYKLMGFIDAQGKVVSTLFKDWWTNGGVICLDEVDSWLPSATLALNGALANGHCTFPDGMLPRHADCVVVACANTWGLGATSDYVGRMKQDAAFLDRFACLDWTYDESLELAIAGNPAWAKRVQGLRAKAKAKGLKVIISPRASINGARLLAEGMDQLLVEMVTVRKAMTAEQWESIQ